MRISNVIPFATAIMAITSGPSRAEQSVYYQQNARVRVNGHPLTTIYRDSRDVELREAQPSDNFDGGSFGGGQSVLGNDSPAGSSLESAYLLRFDEIFSEKYVPLPPGSQVTQALLFLDFSETGDDLILHRCVTNWQESSTWNNVGTPSDGVSVPADAINPSQFVIRGTPGGQVVLDVTADVVAWASGDPNHGWAIRPSGSDDAVLRNIHYLDSLAPHGGKTLWVGAGFWGVRSTTAVHPYVQSQAHLLDDGDFGAPALLVSFTIPVGADPPEFAELDPNPGPWPGPGPGPGPGPRPPGGHGPRVILHPDGNPRINVEHWPDTRVRIVASGDLENWETEIPAREIGPGRFQAEDTDGTSHGQLFYRGEAVDRDGDRQLDRVGGASPVEDEACPENALADLFSLISRTGQQLQDAHDELHRNELISEIDLMYRGVSFISYFTDEVDLAPFTRSFTGLLMGGTDGKALLPLVGAGNPTLNSGIPDLQTARNTLKRNLEFLQMLVLWQRIDSEDLTRPQRTEIDAFLSDLKICQEQLCAISENDLDPFFLADLQNGICLKIAAARAREGIVATFMGKLLGYLAEKGVTKLFEVMASRIGGKSFANGAYGAAGTVVGLVADAYSLIQSSLLSNDLEKANRDYNKALCLLYDTAIALPKFNLGGGNLSSYDVWHSRLLQGPLEEDDDTRDMELKTTKVTVSLMCWRLTPNGEPGEGEWRDESVNTTTSTDQQERTTRTFQGADASRHSTGSYFHRIFMNLRAVDQAEKCMLKIETERTFCTKNGPTEPVRETYFVGVVSGLLLP